MNIDDITDDIETEGSEQEGQESGEGKKPVATQVQPIVQQQIIDSRALAREIVGALSQEQMSANHKTALQVWVQEQLDEGTPVKAIKALLKMREAERADDFAARQARAPHDAMDRLQRSIDGLVSDEFDSIERKLRKDYPGIAMAKPGLIEQFRQEFHTNPEYKPEVRKIDALQFPDREVVREGLAKTIDTWLKKMGVTERQMPVQRGNGKASAPNRGTNPTANLDQHQTAMYKSIRRDCVAKYGKDKGEAKALELARGLYDE